MLLEREEINPNTTDKGIQALLRIATTFRHTGVVKILQERCRVTQNMVITGPVAQTSHCPTSEKQHGRAPKRRVENQGSVPQSASGSIPGDLLAKPSNSSQHRSKMPRKS